MVPTDALDAAAVVAAGRAAWPELGPAPAWVDAYLAAQLVGGRAPASAHAAEVALVCALAHGDPVALRIFEATYVPTMREAVRRLRLAPDLEADVVQAMRVDLLVGDGTRAPRIDTYLGHGPLVAWLRVSAIRRALTLRRSTNREESLEELVLAGWPGPSPDAAASDAGGRLLRQTYTAHLKTALTTALAELSVRERNLLRHSIIDELTVDELALMYRVHRSTCARWLVDARAALGRATRRALSDQLGPLEGQLDSVLRLVESDVELSLSRLMRDAG